jgi:hypothetical protein
MQALARAREKSPAQEQWENNGKNNAKNNGNSRKSGLMPTSDRAAPSENLIASSFRQLLASRLIVDGFTGAPKYEAPGSARPRARERQTRI